VIRAGDVIPEIVARVTRAGRRRSRPFVMPARCPACHSTVVRERRFNRCPNALACPAQLEGAIRHFASREALDIRGLGPETVEALVSSGLVRSVADLFALRAPDLVEIERFAEVSAANLLHAIDRARRPPLWRFLHALGIPAVGAQTARDLATYFGSLERVQSADEHTLMNVPNVGPKVAQQIAAFFRRSSNRQVIEACRRRGVQVVERAGPRDGPLAGKTLVFTGGLESMSREAAEERARASGARTARSVGAGTDLVVAGHDPGAKYARARALGVRIIDEKQFRKLIAVGR
jgi:DNA ligase (NAD+)